MGITYKEKVFFDILITVRDSHGFSYTDKKCMFLAQEIKELVDDKSKFTDWTNRIDIKARFESNLMVMLYKHGYPPELDKEIFEKIISQTENVRKYA